MRLPNTAHTSQPWRIHELTRDFRLEDVWALPTPGGPDDFHRLVGALASADPSHSSSRVAQTLCLRHVRENDGLQFLLEAFLAESSKFIADCLNVILW